MKTAGSANFGVTSTGCYLLTGLSCLNSAMFSSYDTLSSIANYRAKRSVARYSQLLAGYWRNGHRVRRLASGVCMYVRGVCPLTRWHLVSKRRKLAS